MKNTIKAGVLLLFVALLSVFVAYRSGLLLSPSETPVLLQVPSKGITYDPDPDTPDTKDGDTTVQEGVKVDNFNFDPRMFSSKSMIIQEDWDANGAALKELLQKWDSIEKLDSAERIKAWETLSPL